MRPGADRVAEWALPPKAETAKCYGCFVALMEVLYRVWRDEDKAAGQLAYQQCLALPMEWLSSTDALLVKAAEYKALYPLSMADAWITACASGTKCRLTAQRPGIQTPTRRAGMATTRSQKIQ